MNGGLYNSANSRGLPPSVDGVPSSGPPRAEPPRPGGIYGRPLGEEVVSGPVSVTNPA